MRILIVRHGDPDYVHDSLTEKGRREAELLSKRLVREPLRDIYLSPLGRAQATARYTLDKLHREGETLPWLQEFHARISDPVRGASVIPWDLMPAYWTTCPELRNPDAWQDNSLFRLGDVADVYREMSDGLDAVLARYGYCRSGRLYRVENGGCTDTIIFFCHFGIGMAMLSWLLNFAPSVGWQSFFLAPTSVTELVTEERMPGFASFRALRVGDVSHLDAGSEPASRSGLFEETAGEAKR